MVKKLLGIVTIIGLLMACSNEGNQTNNNQIIDDKNDQEEEVKKKFRKMMEINWIQKMWLKIMKLTWRFIQALPKQ